jgi:hypothetical protein
MKRGSGRPFPTPVVYTDLYRELEGIKTLMDQQMRDKSPFTGDEQDNNASFADDWAEIEGVIVDILKKYEPKK